MTLVVDDVEHRLDGARVTLRRSDESAVMTLDALGDAAVDSALQAVAVALESGASLEEAARSARATAEVPGRCARIRTADGIIVLDDTAATTAFEVRRSLKVLADATRGVTRSFAVVGELVSDPAEWFDDHDQLGRLVVRLDISQLIVVGHGARHAATAAGLEGSWDGESLLVDDVAAAYDELRARLRPGDAVLVTAAGISPLDALIARLTEDTA
jgi:UDP-N-acetylmuramoyl-tripeptide--D-alanyl-D-alanine ligase